MEKFYKIQNPQGEFSNGGLEPKFSNDGKSWKSKQEVHTHFSEVIKYSKNPYCRVDNLHKIYNDCKVVLFEMKVSEELTFDNLQKEAKTWPKEEDRKKSLKEISRKKDETLKRLNKLKNLLKSKQGVR